MNKKTIKAFSVMKKIFIMILAILMPLMANADASGSCGNNLTWTYVESTHTLTISGTGEMNDYGTLSGISELSLAMDTNIKIPWASISKEIQILVINEGVTSVGSISFNYCYNLTSVSIPESVISIKEGAFLSCQSLKSLTIGSGLKSIGEGAFWGCWSLSSIPVLHSVTSIGQYAFSGTSWYNNQPSGLVYAGKVAYKYKGTMPNDTNIDLLEGTLSITPKAFSGCNGLTSVTIPNSVFYIGEQAFEETSWYNNQPSGLVYAGKVAYKYKGTMPNDTNIDLLEGTLSITPKAFSGCNGLTSVTIPNSVTSIGSSAFENCSNLAFISIPQNLTTIESCTFSGCNGLTSVTIPYGVNSIGESAFKNCSGMTSVTIPASVTSIGQSAFSGCSGLKSVHISDIAAWCNIQFSDSYSNPIYYAHHLYKDGKEITNLVIPAGVTSISGSAFKDCIGLTTVTIPAGVTSIGESAFFGCSGLISVTIPEGLTAIGQSVFSGCRALVSVNIPAGVTSLGQSAFSGCSGLTSVTMPDGLTSISESAFKDCRSLTSVIIPASVTSIGQSVFSGCSGLTSVTIPTGLTSISESAFTDCWGMSSVNIPSGVTSIGQSAFSGCRSLSSITIPNSVTSIGSGAFYKCSGLTSLSISEDLSIIKKSTFYGCSSLETLVIPAKVQFIYQEAFAACTKLKEVIVLPENPPFLYDNSFSNYDITLKAPENALEKYSSTDPWSKFTTFKTLTGEDLVKKKCEKPTISVIDGKLEFGCVTEDVEYNWSITTSNGSSGKGNSVPFTQTFVVSVYASKSGYENSDVTTQEFSGSGLSGDVDGNGVVNVADHVKLSDIIMNQ